MQAIDDNHWVVKSISCQVPDGYNVTRKCITCTVCTLPMHSHYTALSLSVNSYVSTCMHVITTVMTIAMVTSASTYTVYTHCKSNNLETLNYMKISNLRM